MRLVLEPAFSHVPFSVDVGLHGRRSAVVIKGEIDRATVGAFAAALDTGLDRGSSIDVDLERVTFIDSSGLRALYEAHLRLGQLPEAIVLIDPCPAVVRALHLLRLDDLFVIVHRTREGIAR